MVTQQHFISITMEHKEQLTQFTLLAFPSLKGLHANTCGLMPLVYLRAEIIIMHTEHVHVQGLTIIEVGFLHLLETTITVKLDSKARFELKQSGVIPFGMESVVQHQLTPVVTAMDGSIEMYKHPPNMWK